MALKLRLSLSSRLNLNIRTVIDNLLLDEAKKRKRKATRAVTANLQAMGVLDEGGARSKAR